MTNTRQRIRLEDLRNPIPTEAHRRALEQAERDPVELTDEAVREAARRQTGGLDDFGPDEFRERLRHWLNETGEDSERTALGRTHTFQRCVRFASMRLRLQELLRRHPEVHDIPIERPIIVIGPWRSGTTHLHRLLATDTRLRSLPLWEIMEPITALRKAVTPDRNDPRIGRCADALQEVQALLPHLAALHTFDRKHSGPA